MSRANPPGVFIPDLIDPERRIGPRRLDFSRRVAVMAIVNRTPDSFHDRGRTYALDQAVEAANRAVADGATLVITHSLAIPPRTPVIRPTYNDPGHDLNKNTYHSLELTRRLNEITGLGYPTLAAVSNKDFIGETLDLPQDQRLEGTVATLVVCILQGARIVRVHDVRAAVCATRITEAILGWRPPAVARHNLA